jgi:hypothetical protein
MSIREKINEKKNWSIGVASLLMVLGTGAIFYQVSDSFSGTTSRGPTQFYTSDDGITWFTDDSKRLPPFDHEGQQAVLAHVFRCDSNLFVAYLERFTPEAQRIISTVENAARQSKPGDKPPPELAQVESAQRFGREVKRPGDKKWVPISHPDAGKIMNVVCPDTGQIALREYPH